MPATQTTRQIGHICRIYKNSNDKVLAIDEISVTANVLRTGNTSTDVKFHISVDKITPERMLLHLEVGSRVVASIQQIGNYDSVTIDSGDYLLVTWNKESDNENDVQFSLEPYVAKIGDTV